MYKGYLLSCVVPTIKVETLENVLFAFLLSERLIIIIHVNNVY